jgi:Flp pilus assembly protein TadD
MRLDRLDEAEQCLLSAQRLHKQAKNAYSEATDMGQLGELYVKQGRVDLAKVHFLKAIELSVRSRNIGGEKYWSNRLEDVKRGREDGA